jgi:hypothetical protein
VFACSFLIGDRKTPTERGGVGLRYKTPGRVVFLEKQSTCAKVFVSSSNDLTDFLQKEPATPRLFLQTL